MSIDGQVLVVAFLALLLKLLLWAQEGNGVEVEDEPHRKDAFHFDGRLPRARGRAHSAGPVRLIVKASNYRGDKR